MPATVVRRIDNGDGTTTVVVSGKDFSEVNLVVPNSKLDDLGLLDVYELIADYKSTAYNVPYTKGRRKRPQ